MRIDLAPAIVFSGYIQQRFRRIAFNFTEIAQDLSAGSMRGLSELQAAFLTRCMP